MRKDIPVCFQTYMLALKEKTMMKYFEISLLVIQILEAIYARYLGTLCELCACSCIRCYSP